MSFSDAWNFAIEAHGDQRYGDGPYSDHLAQVHDLLVTAAARAGVPLEPELPIAAILHDVLEDTKVTQGQLIEKFGGRVATLVWAVTKDQGRNRREKNERCLPRIPTVPGAILIKLPDIICNVENCWATRDSRLFMYHGEYSFFRRTLYLKTVGMETDVARLESLLWARLDKLLGWRD